MASLASASSSQSLALASQKFFWLWPRPRPQPCGIWPRPWSWPRTLLASLTFLALIYSCLMRVFYWQMNSFDVEHLRQVLEEETESLNRGSADEVICITKSN